MVAVVRIKIQVRKVARDLDVMLPSLAFDEFPSNAFSAVSEMGRRGGMTVRLVS